MAELLVDAPARALAIYAHPDDPGCLVRRHAGRVGEGRLRGDRARCAPTAARVRPTRRSIPRELVAAAGDRGGRRRGAARCGRPGVARTIPTVSWSTTRVLREALVAAVRRLRPEVVLCPDPTAVFFGQEYFNHRDHRVTGWAALDAVAPAASLPHYFPECRCRPTRWRRCCCRERSSPTSGWTSRPPSTSRVRRSVATAASSPTAWNGRRRRCRLGAEDAGRQAGVAYAEGFRRLRLGG